MESNITDLRMVASKINSISMVLLMEGENVEHLTKAYLEVNKMIQKLVKGRNND